MTRMDERILNAFCMLHILSSTFDVFCILIICSMLLGFHCFICHMLHVSVFTGQLVHCRLSSTSETAYEGGTVQLVCATNFTDPTYWGFRNGKFLRIYTEALVKKYKEEGRHSVLSRNGFSNLTISNLTEADSGTYVCQENAGLVSSETVLTVLGK
jgi:hypothetical protein